MKRAMLAVVMGVASLVTSAAASAAPAAVTLDDKFEPAAQAAMLVKADGQPDKVKGLKRVAITAFDVEFITKGSASASATEIGQRGTASVSSYVKLVGVDDKDFQQIADQLYAQFAAELKATGVELVPLDEIRKTASFQKMAAAGKPAPLLKQHGKESGTVVTAEGRPVIGLGLAVRGGTFAALGNFGAITSGISGSIDMQKELDATLMEVRMGVRFVDLASSSSSFLNRISGEASVKGKVSPTVVADLTVMTLQSGSGAASYRLQRPLSISPAAISELKNTTSAATNVGLAVLSMAIGSGSSSQVSEHEAIADPVLFRDLVGRGLGQAGSMMVQHVKALR